MSVFCVSISTKSLSLFFGEKHVRFVEHKERSTEHSPGTFFTLSVVLSDIHLRDVLIFSILLFFTISFLSEYSSALFLTKTAVSFVIIISSVGISIWIFISSISSASAIIVGDITNISSSSLQSSLSMLLVWFIIGDDFLSAIRELFNNNVLPSNSSITTSFSFSFSFSIPLFKFSDKDRNAWKESSVDSEEYVISRNIPGLVVDWCGITVRDISVSVLITIIGLESNSFVSSRSSGDIPEKLSTGSAVAG